MKNGIESLSHESRVFDPPPSVRDRAWIKSLEQYRALYDRSLKDGLRGRHL